MKKLYLVEVRDEKGQLMTNEESFDIRKKHPFLFLSTFYSMNDLCYYASFGQNRDERIGPMQIGDWFKKEGLTYREKTW